MNPDDTEASTAGGGRAYRLDRPHALLFDDDDNAEFDDTDEDSTESTDHDEDTGDDEDDGGFTRPYYLTKGRAGNSGTGVNFLSHVMVPPSRRGALFHDPGMLPEHVTILDLCEDSSVAVPEVAARCNLYLGVTQVLISDLVEKGLLVIEEATATADLRKNPRFIGRLIRGVEAL